MLPFFDIFSILIAEFIHAHEISIIDAIEKSTKFVSRAQLCFRFISKINFGIYFLCEWLPVGSNQSGDLQFAIPGRGKQDPRH